MISKNPVLTQYDSEVTFTLWIEQEDCQEYISRMQFTM
jgi:hypothetical protein